MHDSNLGNSSERSYTLIISQNCCYSKSWSLLLGSPPFHTNTSGPPLQKRQISVLPETSLTNQRVKNQQNCDVSFGDEGIAIRPFELCKCHVPQAPVLCPSTQTPVLCPSTRAPVLCPSTRAQRRKTSLHSFGCLYPNQTYMCRLLHT